MAEQECIPLRGDHKEPPMPLIHHPLQSAIPEDPSLPSALFSPKSSIHMQRNSMAKICVPFLSRQHASTTDGEFLKHETRRERLMNWGMGREVKSITKLLRRMAAPSS